MSEAEYYRSKAAEFTHLADKATSVMSRVALQRGVQSWLLMVELLEEPGKAPTLWADGPKPN